jgi:hypothetical protein
MKLLFNALVIVGVLYGLVQFTRAGYGWFQMSGVVDDVAQQELPALIERARQSGAVFGASGFERDGYARMHQGILKGAEEARVPLRDDAVQIGVVDNMLEVRLAWESPLVVYDGRSYVDVPFSMQRRFSLEPRKGY